MHIQIGYFCRFVYEFLLHSHIFMPFPSCLFSVKKSCAEAFYCCFIRLIGIFCVLLPLEYMKKIVSYIFMFVVTLSAMAQEVATSVLPSDAPSPLVSSPTPSIDATALSDSISVSGDGALLNIPTLTELGTMPSMRLWPYMWSGFHSWDLHEGLNASIGLSVFSTFGSGNTYSGAGFGQRVALMYAKPLTERLSMAVGGYFSNLDWGHSQYRDAGLTAVLGYRFDEHWSAYLYGQKSMTPNTFVPLPLMDMNEMGDRIGTAVRYDFSPSFSVQISCDWGTSRERWIIPGKPIGGEMPVK